MNVPVLEVPVLEDCARETWVETTSGMRQMLQCYLRHQSKNSSTSNRWKMRTRSLICSDVICLGTYMAHDYPYWEADVIQ